MKKNTWKRIGALTLLGVFSASASGSTVYMMMHATKQNQDVGDDDITIPDIDDNNEDKEETNLSKTLNSLLNSKEISSGNIFLSIKPVGKESIDLKLNSLDVDLSKLNTSVVNVATDVQVLYGKTSTSAESSIKRLDQTLSLRVEENEACYVTFKNRNFCFDIPQNLSDLMEIFKALGLVKTNDATSTSSLDLSSIVSKIQDMAGEITATDSIEDTGSDLVHFDISIPEITIGNTKIGSDAGKLNLTLYATKDTYRLKKLQTKEDIAIYSRKDESSSFEKNLSLSLDGQLELKEVSSYKTLTAEQISTYSNVTDANTSIFSTIHDILGNDSDVSIGVHVEKSVSDASSSSVQSSFDVNGLLAMDYKKNNYALSLDHLGADNENLNSLDVKYIDKNLYLKMNELIKGRISDTKISEMFSYITKITSSPLIEVFASETSTVLGTLDIDRLKDGDMTQIQGLLEQENTYFDYDSSTSSFSLSIDGSYLGLTDGAIVLKIKCSSEKKIEKITIEGLSFSSTDSTSGKKDTTTISLSLTPKASTEETKKELRISDEEKSQYQNLAPACDIFSSISNFAQNEKFLADYTLTYNDKINDGTNDNYSLISASGVIGADLSSVTSKGTILDKVTEGDYVLSMKASCGESVHNLNMNYQDNNLYFGYDTIYGNNPSNTVFRNEIENVNLGKMMTVLDKKTDSSVSVSFDQVSKVLDFLGMNEDFQNAIKKVQNGSLIGFDDVFTLTSNEDENGGYLSLVLNIDKIFKTDSLIGKNLSNITILLSTKDKSMKSLSISTKISSSQDFSFTLNFFSSFSSFQLDEEACAKYQKIEDFNTIVDSFYNLGNQIEKYGIKVNAEYKKDPTLDENGSVLSYGSALTLSGSAYWDLSVKEDPKFAGSLVLSHPFVSIDNTLSVKKTQADQKLKFKYQKDSSGDGELTADYNEHLHAVLHSSTIKDMVNTISSTSETSLLNNLLDTSSSVASNMPIKDVISLSAPSLLLSYPYIQSVDFSDTENEITIKVDKRLYNIKEEGDSVILKIKYEDSQNPILTSLSVDLSKEGKIVCKGSIELVPYSEEELPSVLEYNDDNKGKFVSLDGLKNLTKMMIDTTENNYFHFQGYLNLDFTMFENSASQQPINLDALCFDLNFNVSLYIDENGDVNTYLALKVGNQTIQQSGYYVTEFAFTSKEDIDYVYMDNTRTDAVLDENENVINQVSSTAYRVTKTEFENNILYYLVSQGLGIDDRIAGKTVMANIYQALKNKEDGTESSSAPESENVTSLTTDLSIQLNSDFSSLFNVYDENNQNTSILYNEAKQKFSFNLNLNELLSVKVGSDDDSISLLSFDNVYLKLYHYTIQGDEKKTPFYAAQLSCELNVLSGLAKVSLKGGIQAVSTGNYVDMGYYDSKTDVSQKSGMARMNSLISLIDSNCQDDLSLSIETKTKRVYDFGSMQLTTFINDYSVTTVGSDKKTKCLADEYDVASYPFLFDYANL